MKRRVALSALALSMTACATPEPAEAADARAFIDQAEALRVTRRIPGLAVVVLRGTRVVLAKGLGVADIETGVALTPDTLFNIASVSKPIAAVVALRLVERGLLDLDLPLSRYAGFDNFCAGARQAGGLFFADFDCANASAPLTLRHLLSMTANGTPGTRFLYNPPAFSWASRPMAQAAGLSFSDLTVREVFGPAGMRESARIHRALPLPPAWQDRLAQPHRIDGQDRMVRSPAPAPQGDGAAGGVISSVMDLARFDIALSEGRLLQAVSLRAMWSAGTAPSGATLPYGLGWFVQDFQGERLLWHSGLWEEAYSALYLKVPARKLTLILLANSDGLRWDSRLDEAAVQRSPFVVTALSAFSRSAA